jgi:group I intron endonuclease
MVIGRKSAIPIFIIKQNMAYVYIITNKINGKKYIGSSRKPQIDENYYGSGKVVKDALKKYGKENFTRDILWQGEGDARGIETCYLIAVNASKNPMYYNMTNDARGNNLHQESTKRTVSEKLKGRKLLPEQIEKIRLAKTGKPNPKKGKSDGPKPGVSEAHKGRISPNKGKGNQVALYTTSGEYIKTYSSYYDLAIDLQINPETVRCQLIGKAQTIKNKQYKAQYV